MSVIQFGSRLLTSQCKLTTTTLKRMYGKKKKMIFPRPRPWNAKLIIKNSKDPLPCFTSLRRSENRCNQPRLKTTDKDKNLALRKRRLELQKPTTTVPCYMSLRRSENRCNQPRLKPMQDECIKDPCGLAPLPMDLEHYTPSDKYLRKYQRTWCETHVLPNKFVMPKKQYPNRPRRKLRRKRNTTECVMGLENPKLDGRLKPEKLIDVQHIGRWPCCKLVAPDCEPGRPLPSCSQHFPPSCCKKRRTQYPSFSECQPVGLLDPIPPCECDKKPMMCEVWAEWRRIQSRSES